MNKFVIFILGAASGSIGTYFAVKQVIQSKADEEIESVVKTFHDRFEKLTDILTDEQKEKAGVVSPSKEMKKDIEEKADNFKKSYQKDLEDLGYSVGVDLSEDQSAEATVENNTEEKKFIAPYIITENEFGEIGYEESELIWYADNVLADTEDDIIDDPESILGDCLNGFGEYDEVMYVRNENIVTDYVISKSEKYFSDIAPEVND